MTDDKEPLKPDYTRCEHRFYFEDKNEWSSWSESFEPGEVSTEIDSEIAEVEVRNVLSLFSAETIVGVESEELKELGIDPEQFVREELPEWIPGILQAIIEDRCRPDNCDITEEEDRNAEMCDKHLKQREEMTDIFQEGGESL